MGDRKHDVKRVAKALAPRIEYLGEATPWQHLIGPTPTLTHEDRCWIWRGAFRPKTINPDKPSSLGLIRWPRPITTVHTGIERHPVKPLMCLAVNDLSQPEPGRIQALCKNRDCVNPHHFRALQCKSEIINAKFGADP